jgi:hypothetical protein
VNDSGGTGVADGIVDAHDPLFYIASDLSGRRIATFQDTDQYPKETFLWHPAGISGPTFQGGLIARDRNDDLIDPTLWATEAGGSSRDERVYACSDFRGNVVALVASSIQLASNAYPGGLVEQYRYSATGVPFGIPLGNAEATGSVQTSDLYTVINDEFGTYTVRSDFDLDGADGTSDLFTVLDQLGVTTGRGGFSASAVMNRVGKSNGQFGVATTELALLGGLENPWNGAPPEPKDDPRLKPGHRGPNLPSPDYPPPTTCKIWVIDPYPGPTPPGDLTDKDKKCCDAACSRDIEPGQVRFGTTTCSSGKVISCTCGAADIPFDTDHLDDWSFMQLQVNKCVRAAESIESPSHTCPPEKAPDGSGVRLWDENGCAAGGATSDTGTPEERERKKHEEDDRECRQRNWIIGCLKNIESTMCGASPTPLCLALKDKIRGVTRYRDDMSPPCAPTNSNPYAPPEPAR